MLVVIIFFFSPAEGITKYTLCVIFRFWKNRNFTINKRDSNSLNLLSLIYSKTNNEVTLTVNTLKSKLTIPNYFDGKKIVIWLVEDFSQNITKVKISNYSAILSLQSVRYSNEQEFFFYKSRWSFKQNNVFF